MWKIRYEHEAMYEIYESGMANGRVVTRYTRIASDCETCSIDKLGKLFLSQTPHGSSILSSLKRDYLPMSGASQMHRGGFLLLNRFVPPEAPVSCRTNGKTR